MASCRPCVLAFALVCLASLATALADEEAANSKQLRGLDLVFLVHFSKKNTRFEFGLAKEFMNSLVRGGDVDSGALRVAYVNYRKTGRKMFDLDDHNSTAKVLAAIGKSRFLRSKQTSAAKGLYTVKAKLLRAKSGDRKEVPNAVIVITDEPSNRDQAKLAKSANSLHKKDSTEVFVVAVGPQDNQKMVQEAKTMATGPGKIFRVESMDELMSIREKLVAKLPALQGDVSEFLPVVKPVGDVEGATKLDIVFLIRTSRNINRKTYKLYKSFMKDIISGAKVDSGEVRVGVVIYRQRGKVGFLLNKHKTRKSLTAAINRLKLYSSKKSSVAAGMDMVREKLLQPEAGDRADAPNLVLVLTDTDSEIQANRIKHSARKLREAGAKVFAVGVGLKSDDQLQRIVSSNGDAFMPTSLDGLTGTKDVIVNKISALRQRDQAGDAPVTVSDSRKADIFIAYHLMGKTSVAQINKFFKPFLISLIDKADVDSGDVRISLINLAKRPRVAFNLGKYSKKADMVKEIQKIGRKSRARANWAGKLFGVIRTKFLKTSFGDRPDVPNAVIFITNNKGNQKLKAVARQAALLKQAGTKIITLGYDKAAPSELTTIASEPEAKNSFYVSGMNSIGTPEMLSNLQSTILALQDAPAPTPPAPRVTTTEAVVSGVDLQGTDRADIVFALHFSKSRENFERVVSYLKSLMATADVDGRRVRFGLYLDRRIVEFNLNQYTSNQALANALDQMRYRQAPAKFDLTGTLRYVRERMFTPRSGDREDAPNALIIITDTNSGQGRREIDREASRTAQAGISTFTVGIDLGDKGELEWVASSPSNVFSYASYDALNQFGAAVRAPIRAMNTRRAPPTPPARTTAGPTPPQEIDCLLAKADLIIIVDSSTSVTRQNFRKVLSFIKDFLNKADIDSGNVRVGVIVYSIDVNQIFQLNTYNRKADILRAVDNIAYSFGSTNTAGALDEMRNQMFTPWNGDRPDVPNVAVVITDGVSTVNPKNTIPFARAAHDDGIHIYSIGIGLTDTKELDGIATPPASENSFKVPDFDALQQVDDLIFASACPKQFKLERPTKTTPKPTRTTPKPTTTTQKPTTEKPTTTTTPLPTTTTTEAEKTSTTAAPATTTTRRVPVSLDTGYDVIFMLDSTVDNRIFGWMKTFVRNFANKMNVDSGVWRAGAMTFDSRGKPGFQLNRYNFQDEVIAGVDRLTNRPSRRNPNVAGAFDYVRQNMFVQRQGDRPRAHNFVVLLTGNEKSFKTEESYAAAQRLKDLGAGVFTVGLNIRDSFELDEISSKPLYQYRTLINDENELAELPLTYKFTMESAPAPTTRRTTLPPTTTTTPPTTTTTTTTTRRTPVFSETGYDIIFMLDSSVDDRIFGWMKTFVKNFANNVDVDSGIWRAGGMTFDTRGRANFHLKRYNFQDEVINGIEKMNNRPSNRDPDVAAAFDYVRRSMFTDRQGDRRRAPNYVVMLTGNEKSLNTERSIAAAQKLKDLGTGVFTIGLNFRDSSELDEISSKPLYEYRTLIFNENELAELPQTVRVTIENAAPPTTRRTTTTTTTTTTIAPYTGDCKSKGDIVFLLDTSGSVGSNNYALMRNFTYNTVRDLEIDNGFFRIGLMTFSDSSTLEFQLNTYTKKEEIYDALRRMPYNYGMTYTAEALRRVRTEMFTGANGDRPNVQNLLVIVTDGQSNIEPHETVPEARRLKAMGVTIVTVSIGVYNNTELRGLTSPPIDKNLIEVMDFNALHKLSEVIIAPLCTDADMCARNPCQNEGQCIDGLRSYMCLCSPGFYGDNCEKSCGPAADVVLMLDSSNSMGSVVFDRIKSYAQQMVTDMEVLSCGINIGVMKYSSRAMVQFHLGEFFTEEEINQAIQGIGYTPGPAYMAEALRVMRTEMFNGRNGDRYDARNIAYLLTDGSVEVNRDLTNSEVELSIDSGIRIIPLAVAVRDRTEINFIAESQGIPLLEIDSEESLSRMSDQVLEAVHDGGKGVDHCDPNPCENGGECHSEPLGFTCKCAQGYAGTTCDRECDNKADIVFVVDSSRYNSVADFRATKRFLRDIVKRMAFRHDSFRVGIIAYGSTATVRLALSEGNKKRTVKSSIGSLRRMAGDPKLDSALSAVSGLLATGRPKVQDYVVLVTRRVDSHATVSLINSLKIKGTRVVGVGVDMSNTDRVYLKAAVSPPIDQSLFFADDPQDLRAMSMDFINFVCHERNFCANNPCENGGTCVNGEKTFMCHCPTGFAGPQCSKTCDDRADIVFLVDSSGSVGFDSFTRIKAYLRHLVESLNIGIENTRVGVATFSDQARPEIYLDQYTDKKSLLAAITGLSYVYGNTNTASGIKLVRNSIFSTDRGNRMGVPDFLIIITDGLSNINNEATIPEAELARKQGIHIMSVGVGIADPWELKAMASKPTDTNVFQVQTFEDLWTISDTIVNHACRDNGVCEPNPCQNGGTCEAGIGTFTCSCQQGFLGEFCDQSCEANKDITFILDASASVGPRHFEKMLSFAADIVKDLTMHGQDHRFSLITFSTEVRTIFSFSRYSGSEQVIEAIKTTPYYPGSAYTAGALSQTIQMYSSGYGERPTADNIAILMTDGPSNYYYWDTIPAAEKLKAKGVRVMAIGVGITDMTEVNGIASSDTDVYQVARFDELDQIKLDVIENFCQD